MQITKFLCALLFLLPLKLPSQVNSNEDIKAYFDEGNRGNIRNIVSLNAVPLATGDLSIYYERVLTRFLSLELGIGKMMPWTPLRLKMMTDAPRNFASGSRSFLIYPKFYIQKPAPEFFFLGMQYRNWRIKLDTGEPMTFQGFGINAGFNIRPYNKRYFFGFAFGPGFQAWRLPGQDKGGWVDRMEIFAAFDLKFAVPF